MGLPEVRDTRIRIVFTPPQGAEGQAPSAQPKTITLNGEEFIKTIEQIGHELQVEQDVISAVILHAETGFSIETKDSFEGPTDYYTYLIYAHLLKSLGYNNIKTDGSDKELGETLLAAVTQYKTKKQAELANAQGVSVDMAGGLLTGTLLLLLARDYQLQWYPADQAGLESAQAQIVVANLVFNDEVKELAQKALAEFEIEEGLLETIKKQAEETKQGYTVPAEIDGPDAYYNLVFYAQLLKKAGYDINLNGSDADLISTTKAAIAKLNQDHTLPEGENLSPKAILLLIKLYGQSLSQKVDTNLQRLINEYAQNNPNADAQFQAVLEGNQKIIIIYDKEAKEYKVLEIQDGRTRVVPLDSQAVAAVLIGSSAQGEDGAQRLANNLLGLATGDKKKDKEAFTASAKLRALFQAGKMTQKGLRNGRKLLNSGYWDHIKSFATTKAEGSELARFSQSQDLVNLCLRAGVARADISEALMAALYLDSNPNATKFLDRTREIHQETGLAYPLKLKGKQFEETGTLSSYLLFHLFELPDSATSHLQGEGLIAVVVDAQTLEKFLGQQQMEKDLTERLETDPRAVFEDVSSNPDKYKDLGYNTTILKWRAKIKMLAKDNELTEAKVNELVAEINDDPELQGEEHAQARELVIQNLIETRIKVLATSKEDARTTELREAFEGELARLFEKAERAKHEEFVGKIFEDLANYERLMEIDREAYKLAAPGTAEAIQSAIDYLAGKEEEIIKLAGQEKPEKGQEKFDKLVGAYKHYLATLPQLEALNAQISVNPHQARLTLEEMADDIAASGLSFERYRLNIELEIVRKEKGLEGVIAHLQDAAVRVQFEEQGINVDSMIENYQALLELEEIAKQKGNKKAAIEELIASTKMNAEEFTAKDFKTILTRLYKALISIIVQEGGKEQGVVQAKAYLEQNQYEIQEYLYDEGFEEISNHLRSIEIKQKLTEEFAKLKSGEISQKQFKAYLAAIPSVEGFNLTLALAEVKIQWFMDHDQPAQARKVYEKAKEKLNAQEALQLKSSYIQAQVNKCLKEGHLELAERLLENNKALFDQEQLGEMKKMIAQARKNRPKIDQGTIDYAESIASFNLRAYASEILTSNNETNKLKGAMEVLGDIQSGQVAYKKGPALIVEWSGDSEGNTLLDLSRGFGLAAKKVVSGLAVVSENVDEELQLNGGFLRLLQEYKSLTGQTHLSDKQVLISLAGKGAAPEIDVWLTLLRENHVQIKEKTFEHMGRFEQSSIEVSGQTLRVYAYTRKTNANENHTLNIIEEILWTMGSITDKPSWSNQDQLTTFLANRTRAVDQGLIALILSINNPYIQQTSRLIPAEEAARVGQDITTALTEAGLNIDSRTRIISQPLTIYWKPIREGGRDKVYWMICRGETVLQIGRDTDVLYATENFDADEAITYLTHLISGSEFDNPILLNAIMAVYNTYAADISPRLEKQEAQLGGQYSLYAQKAAVETLFPADMLPKALIRAFEVWTELKDKSAEEKLQYLQDLKAKNAEQWEIKATEYAIFGSNGRGIPAPSSIIYNELVAELHKLSPQDIANLGVEIPEAAQKIIASRPEPYTRLPQDFFEHPNALALDNRFFLLLEREYSRRKTAGFEIPAVRRAEYRALLEEAAEFGDIEWKNEPIACMKIALLSLSLGPTDFLPQAEIEQAKEGNILTTITPENILQGIIPAFGSSEYTVLYPISDRNQDAALARLLKGRHIAVAEQNGRFEEVDLPKGFKVSKEQKDVIRKVVNGEALSDEDLLKLETLQSTLGKVAGTREQNELIQNAAAALGHVVERRNGVYVHLFNRRECLTTSTDQAEAREKLEKKVSLNKFADALQAGAFIIDGEALQHIDQDLLASFAHFEISPAIAEGFDQNEYTQIFAEGMKILVALGKKLQGRIVEPQPFEPVFSGHAAGIEQLTTIPFARGFLEAGKLLTFTSEDTLHMGVWPAIKWMVYQGGIDNGGQEIAISAAGTKVAEVFEGLDSLHPENIKQRLETLNAWLTEKLEACDANHQKLLALAYIYGTIKALDTLRTDKDGRIASLISALVEEATAGVEEDKKVYAWQNSEQKKQLDTSMAWLAHFHTTFQQQYEQINKFLMDNRIDRDTYELIVTTFPGILDYGFGAIAQLTGISLDTKLFGDVIKDGAGLDAAIRKGFGESEYLDLTERTSGIDDVSIAKRGLNRMAATLLMFMNGNRFNVGKAALYLGTAVLVPEIAPAGGLFTDIALSPFVVAGITGAALDGSGFSPALTMNINAGTVEELQANIENKQTCFELTSFASSIANSSADQGMGMNFGLMINAIFAPSQRVSQGLDLSLINPDSPDMLQHATLVGEDAVAGAIQIIEHIGRIVERDPATREKLEELSDKGEIKINVADASVRAKLIAKLRELKAFIATNGAVPINGLVIRDDNPAFSNATMKAKGGAQGLAQFLMDYFLVFESITPGNAIFSVDPYKVAEKYGYEYKEGNLHQLADELLDQILGNEPETPQVAGPEKSPIDQALDVATNAGLTALKWGTLPIYMRIIITGRFAGGANDLASGLHELYLAKLASEAGLEDEADVRFTNAMALLGNGLTLFANTIGQFARFELDPTVLLREALDLWNRGTVEDRAAALAMLSPAIWWGLQALHTNYVYVKESLKVIREAGRIILLGKEGALPADYAPPKAGFLGRMTIQPLQKALHRLIRGIGAIERGVGLQDWLYENVGSREIFRDGRFTEWLSGHVRTAKTHPKVVKSREWLSRQQAKVLDSNWFKSRAFQVPYKLTKGTFKWTLMWWPKAVNAIVQGYDKAQRYNPIRGRGNLTAFLETYNAEVSRLAEQAGLNPEDFTIDRAEAKRLWKEQGRPTREELKVERSPFAGTPGSVEWQSGSRAQAKIFDSVFGKAISRAFPDGNHRIGRWEIVKIRPAAGNQVSLVWDTVAGVEVLYLEIGENADAEAVERKLEAWKATPPSKPQTSRLRTEVTAFNVGEIDVTTPEYKALYAEVDALARQADARWQQTRSLSDADLRTAATDLVEKMEGKELTPEATIERLAQLKEVLRRTTARGLVVDEGKEYLGRIEGREADFGSVKKTGEGWVTFDGGQVERIDNIRMDGHRIMAEVTFRGGAAAKTVELGGIEMYHEQMMEGVAFTKGCILEVNTGEGKTFGFHAGAGLEAVRGRGVYVLTPKEGLAVRDGSNLRAAYEWAGTPAAFVDGHMSAAEKKVAYGKEPGKGGRHIYVTYVERGQAVGDYIHDILAPSRQAQVQGQRRSVFYDEIDTLMFDLNTDFIISSGGEKGTRAERKRVEAIFDGVVRNFFTNQGPNAEFLKMEQGEIKLQAKALELAETIARDHKMDKVEVIRQMRAAVEALTSYQEGVNYVVWGDEIVLISREGEMEQGRRLHDVHTYLELMNKSRGVTVRVGGKTLLSVPYRDFFKAFTGKLVGATGTLGSYAQEIMDIFSVRGIKIPRHVLRVTIDYNTPGATIREKVTNALADVPSDTIDKLQIELRLSDADRAEARQLVEAELTGSKVTDARFVEVNPGRIFATPDQKIEFALDRTSALRADGRATLLAASSIDDARAMRSLLESRGINCEVFDASAPRTQDVDTLMRRASQSGSVTIITNIGGRGNNWFVDRALRIHGMHLIITDAKEYSNVHFQLEGRVARKGEAGSVEVLLDAFELAEAGIDVSRLPLTERNGVEVDATNHEGVLGQLHEGWEARIKSEAFHHASNEAFAAIDRPYAEYRDNFLQEVKGLESPTEMKAKAQELIHGMIERMAADYGLGTQRFRAMFKHIFGVEFRANFFNQAGELNISEARVIDILAHEATQRFSLEGDINTQRESLIRELIERWQSFESAKAGIKAEVQRTVRSDGEGMLKEYQRRVAVEFDAFIHDVQEIFSKHHVKHKATLNPLGRKGWWTSRDKKVPSRSTGALPTTPAAPTQTAGDVLRASGLSNLRGPAGAFDGIHTSNPELLKRFARALEVAGITDLLVVDIRELSESHLRSLVRLLENPSSSLRRNAGDIKKEGLRIYAKGGELRVRAYHLQSGYFTPVKGKHKGQRLWYQATGRGGFAVYDKPGAGRQQLGSIVQKPTGYRFVVSGGGANLVIDPIVTPLALTAADLVRQRGVAIELEAGQPPLEQSTGPELVLLDADKLEAKRGDLLAEVNRLGAEEAGREKPTPKEVVDNLRTAIQEMGLEELKSLDVKNFQKLVNQLRKGAWARWYERGNRTPKSPSGEEILTKQLRTFLPEAQVSQIIESLRWNRVLSWHKAEITEIIRQKIASGQVEINGRRIGSLGELTFEEFKTLQDSLHRTGRGSTKAAAYLRDVWHFNPAEVDFTSGKTKQINTEATERAERRAETREARAAEPVTPKAEARPAEATEPRAETRVDYDLSISLEAPEEIERRLAEVPEGDKIRFRSAEEINLRIRRSLAESWVASEDLIENKLREAGLLDAENRMVDGQSAMELLEALQNMPDRVRKPLVIETAGGRRVTITTEGKGILITLEAHGERGALELRLTASEYRTFVEGRQGFQTILDKAVSQNKGMSPEQVKALVIGSRDKIRDSVRAGREADVSVTVPLVDMFGTRAELESALVKVEFEVDLGRGKKANIEFFRSDLKALVLHPEGSLKYTKAMERISKAIAESGQRVNGRTMNKLLKQIRRNARLATVTGGATAHFSSSAQVEALRVLDAELSKIRSKQMSPKRAQKAYQKAIAKSQKAYVLFLNKAQQKLMERAIELDLAELSEAEVKKIYEEIAREARVDLDKMSPQEREAEIRSIAENFTARGKGMKGYIRYLTMGAPGAGGWTKVGAVGFGVGKMALMGAVLEAPFSIYHQGGFDTATLDKTFEDMWHGAAGWAQFGAISSAAQVFAGMKGHKPTALAIGILTLYSVAEARPEDRAMTLANGGASLAGFLGFAKLAGLGFKFIPGVRNLPGWTQEWIGAGLGILGANLAGTGFGKAVENWEWLNTAVNSDTFNAIANVGAAASPALNAYFIARLGTSRLGTALLTKIGLRSLLNPAKIALPAYVFYKTLTFGMSDTYNAYKEARFFRDEWGMKGDADLFSFVRDGRFYIRAPHNERAFPIYAISRNYPLRKTDPLMFMLAVFLRQQGYLRDFPGSRFEEELSELRSALDEVNFEDGESVGKAFAKYAEILEDEDVCDSFAHELYLARTSFITRARQAGYTFTESQLPPDIQETLTTEYSEFVFLREEDRYSSFIQEQEDKARDLADSLANARRDMLTTGTQELNPNATLDKFKSTLFTEIKETFELTAPYQRQTAMDIFRIITNNDIALETAADDISGLVGGEVSKTLLLRYVEQKRLELSILKSKLAMQEGIVAYLSNDAYFSQLEEVGYLDYIRRMYGATQSSNRRAYSSYTIGSKFKATFTEFLLKKWRTDSENNTLLALYEDRSMPDDYKAELCTAYAQYKESHPEATEEEFARIYTEMIWENNSVAMASNVDRQFSDGGFSLVLLPQQERETFITHLREKHPEINQHRPAAAVGYNNQQALNPETDFTPEMGILLLQGNLSRK